MFEQLRKRFPTEDVERVASLAEVWSVELDRIIKRMLEIADSPRPQGLPIEVREEATLELARLIAWLQERIIEKKTATTPLAQIDPAAERLALDSPLVKERIENTARNCAQAVWSGLRDEWWRRYPVFREAKPRRVKLVRLGNARDVSRSGVKRQHYSPDFSNRYWSDATGKTRVFSLSIAGSVTAEIRPVKKWGKEDFLYSQALERYFSLVEGDAKSPYEKLINMAPLNEGERRYWIAYLACQMYRTPAYIARHLPGLKDIVVRRRIHYPTDTASLRSAYETLFSDSRIFSQIYRMLMGRQWEMWSAPGPDLIRADEPILIEGSTRRGDWMLLYPMTPRKCFVVGPGKAKSPPTIIPHARELDPGRVETLNLSLAATARRTAIAHPQADCPKLQNILATALGRHARRHRAINTERQYWGPIG